MKKIIFILIFTLLSTAISSETMNHTVHGEDAYSLKLRASYHPEFLRIVLEGDERLISKGMVNQKDADIIVRFPNTRFIIQEEKMPITFKTYEDTILFSPGRFTGFKVFSLKYPGRLVIDTYLKPKESDVKRSIDLLRKRWGKNAETSIKSENPEKTNQPQGLKTVVIDPGHGGYESGIIAGQYKEKNIVLDISKRLEALISRESTRGFLTRKSDQFMTLGERIKFTNDKNAEIFLSLHVGNHSGFVLYTPVITESVPYKAKDFLVNKGQEEFMVKTASLRDAMQQAIAEDFGNDMVSTKPLPYSMLSRIEAAALIIELPSFEDAYYLTELKTEFANTIYKGIYIYEESTAH